MRGAVECVAARITSCGCCRQVGGLASLLGVLQVGLNTLGSQPKSVQAVLALCSNVCSQDMLYL